MKLATYRDGSRDGQLVVVSRDLALAHYASAIASRLQQVLDDWNFLSPQLEELSQTLNHGKARHAFAFDPQRCMAPLPRAFVWVHPDNRYGANDVPASRPAGRGRTDERLTANPWAGRMLLRPGDALHGAHDPIEPNDHDVGIDPQLAAVTGDLPAGAAAEAAVDGIRLLMLAGSVRRRARTTPGTAAGADAPGAPPSTGFAPVAVTPDELGGAWRQGRPHVRLDAHCGDLAFGVADCAAAMPADFGTLVAAWAGTGGVRAGSIVGSGGLWGTGRSREAPGDAASEAAHAPGEGADIDGAHGADRIDGAHGADAAGVVNGADGGPASGWLRGGATLRIESFGADGASVFGAIEQRIGAAG
jgi:fumarylacetoacetate (FAA) hydrolase